MQDIGDKDEPATQAINNSKILNKTKDSFIKNFTDKHKKQKVRPFVNQCLLELSSIIKNSNDNGISLNNATWYYQQSS